MRAWLRCRTGGWQVEIFADGRSEDGHGEGGSHAAAEDGNRFEQIRAGEELFDLAGGDVFSFGGFELFLEAADETQAAFFVDLAAIAGAEEAVFGEGLAGEFGIAVVADHVHGALDLDFALGADARESPGACIADVADTLVAGAGSVGDAVLGHAVAFGEVEAHFAIPLDDVDGDSRAAGADQARFAETKIGQEFLADDVADDGDREQAIEFLLVDFFKDALLKADVEARDGEKQGAAGTDEIGEEGGLAFGEEDVDGHEEAVDLDDGALGDVGEGKVREDTVEFTDGVGADGRQHGLGPQREGAEVVHGSFGLAGGAGGVDDCGDVGGVANGVALERGLGGDDVGPERAAGWRVLRRAVGEGDEGEIVEDVFVEGQRAFE